MDFNRIVVFQVKKDEIKTLQFKRAEKMLKALKRVGKQARNSLLITFSGYDDIPEEVYEIPEIRRWSAKFVKRNPEAFYFLCRELEGDQILLTTLCNLSSFYVGEPTKSPNEYYKEGINPEDLPKKQLELILPDGLREHVEKGVMKYGESVDDIEGARASLAIFKIFD